MREPIISRPGIHSRPFPCSLRTKSAKRKQRPLVPARTMSSWHQTVSPHCQNMQTMQLRKLDQILASVGAPWLVAPRARPRATPVSEVAIPMWWFWRLSKMLRDARRRMGRSRGSRQHRRSQILSAICLSRQISLRFLRPTSRWRRWLSWIRVSISRVVRILRSFPISVRSYGGSCSLMTIGLMILLDLIVILWLLAWTS